MTTGYLHLIYNCALQIYQWFEDSNLIPLTAVVAISLFFFKEWLESRRRKRAKKAELAALKTILAKECELNWHVGETIKDICSEFEPYENNEKNCPLKLILTKTPSSSVRFTIVGGQYGGAGGMLPKVHIDVLKEFRFEIAKVNKEFYKLFEMAYGSTIELKHLYDSVIDMEITQKQVGHDNMMVGFSGYAIGELQEIFSNLSNLYHYCTDQTLTKGRLR